MTYNTSRIKYIHLISSFIFTTFMQYFMNAYTYVIVIIILQN